MTGLDPAGPSTLEFSEFCPFRSQTTLGHFTKALNPPGYPWKHSPLPWNPGLHGAGHMNWGCLWCDGFLRSLCERRFERVLGLRGAGDPAGEGCRSQSSRLQTPPRRPGCALLFLLCAPASRSRPRVAGRRGPQVRGPGGPRGEGPGGSAGAARRAGPGLRACPSPPGCSLDTVRSYRL